MQAVFRGIQGLMQGASAVQSMPYTSTVALRPEAQLGLRIISRTRAPF